MLEEALRVFNLKEVVSIKELDKRYQELIRKNYEENFFYNKEMGSINIRLYEWSYLVILPFSMAKSREYNNISLDDLKVLCLLKELNISKDKAYQNYKYDLLLGYKGSFLEWAFNEILKRNLIPISLIDKDDYTFGGEKKLSKRLNKLQDVN